MGHFCGKWPIKIRDPSPPCSSTLCILILPMFSSDSFWVFHYTHSFSKSLKPHYTARNSHNMFTKHQFVYSYFFVMSLHRYIYRVCVNKYTYVCVRVCARACALVCVWGTHKLRDRQNRRGSCHRAREAGTAGPVWYRNTVQPEIVVLDALARATVTSRRAGRPARAAVTTRVASGLGRGRILECKNYVGSDISLT